LRTSQRDVLVDVLVTGTTKLQETPGEWPVGGELIKSTLGEYPVS